MSRVTDEQVQAVLEEFNIDRGGPGIELLYGKRDRDDMRRALEAAIPHLAPVSVTNDPRVVELIEAAGLALDDLELQGMASQVRLRAALANLEKKE